MRQAQYTSSRRRRSPPNSNGKMLPMSDKEKNSQLLSTMQVQARHFFRCVFCVINTHFSWVFVISSFSVGKNRELNIIKIKKFELHIHINSDQGRQQ
jgi:hypothetical protein